MLDNCEHVIGAAAQLCGGLLAACDEVRVLATSREPLAVAGEARYRLGPLTLPSPADPAGGGRSDAVALFADRARRADPRFVLDGQASLSQCGNLCAAVGRHEGLTDPPWFEMRREEQLRQARQALGARLALSARLV